MTWKQSRDPLYRGDSAEGVGLPAPQASPSLVRHILYLEGYGRETPYLSATEERDMAAFFAGKGGRIYLGFPETWSPTGVRHRSRKELLQLLRGTGMGDAKWSSAYEVMRARQYVEEWQEHLADFSSVPTMDETALRGLVNRVFTSS